jgi:branched-chain amino acid transport system permease protein
MIQAIVDGLTMGGIYALLAVGLTVTFGVMNIVNFAHGAFFVLGAFVAAKAVDQGVPLILALLAAFAIIAVLGLAVEVGLFRFTLDRPFNGLVISIGLLAVAEQSVVQLFGSESQPLRPFTFDTVHALGVSVSAERLIVGVVGVALILIYWQVIERSRFGLYTRAVAQDREVAGALGVRHGRIIAANFAIGAGLAAVGGSLLATIQPISAFSAQTPTMLAFTVVVIGTLGSVPGTLLAGLLLGVVQNVGIAYVSPSFAGTYPFLLLMVVLILKPAGLAGGATLQKRVA